MWGSHGDDYDVKVFWDVTPCNLAYSWCRFRPYQGHLSSPMCSISSCVNILNYVIWFQSIPPIASILSNREALYPSKVHHVFQWLRRRFGLVNRFIGSSLVVTTISSYTLKITVTIAHVTSHNKSSNSSSGHTAVPLELRNSKSSQFRRAEQSSSLLPATRQHGHSWHRAPLGPMAIYLFIVKTFFFFFFRCSSFDKKGGVGLFFCNWCSLTTPIPPEVTLK
jgi:hypothetical protein